MTTVGCYEAKTQLPKLLGRVARGEKIVITRHGRAVAMLVPATEEKAPNVREVVKTMKELRKGNILGDELTIRELIEEGRRF